MIRGAGEEERKGWQEAAGPEEEEDPNEVADETPPPPKSFQRLQHQELLQHLRLAGFPNFPSQEHLVHHRVDLQRSRGGC